MKTRLKFQAVGIRDNNRRTPIGPWRASFLDAQTDIVEGKGTHYLYGEVRVEEVKEYERLFYGVFISLEEIGAEKRV